MSESEKLIPILVCRDIAAEHDFLVETLGFSSGGIHRTPDGQAVHGEVRIGGLAIWLHRVADELKLASPRSMPAASSGLFVDVTDVDAHYASTVARSTARERTERHAVWTARVWFDGSGGTSLVVRHSAEVAVET